MTGERQLATHEKHMKRKYSDSDNHPMKCKMIRRLYAVITLVLPLISCVHAQDNSGKESVTPMTNCIITGCITEYGTGEPVDRANILVKGTTRGTETDRSGFYRIKGLPPGVYQLRVHLIGYVPEETDSVVLLDGIEARVNLVLRTKCDTYADSAAADIKKGKVRIRISGEDRRMLSASDEELRQLSLRYGFEYELSIYGRRYPCDSDSYNRVVNDFLERRNGKGWWSHFDRDYISSGYH